MKFASIISSIPPYFRRHKLIQLFLLISPQSNIQLIEFNGSAKLFADLRDPWPRQILIRGACEPEFFSIASKFLAKGGIYFDVGANFGFLSFGLIGHLKHQNIEYHLFEANLETYQVIAQSKLLYPEEKIWINHCCVTNKPGNSNLEVNRHNNAIGFISEQGEQVVKNLVLDDYIKSHLIQKIHFLKMDIEGHEPLGLQGAMASLKNGIVDVIYVEVSTQTLSRSGFHPQDILNLLKTANFRLFYVKTADFESGLANQGKLFTLNVHGYSLTLAEVEHFPDNHQTDILGIHLTSSLELSSGAETERGLHEE